MNWDRASQVLQVVSNVGVVIGLLLVAIQMRQTNESIRATRLDVVNQGGISIQAAIMGDTAADALATARTRPSALDEAQLYRLIAVYDAYLSTTLSHWEAYRSGLISSDDWAYAKSVVPLVLGTPAARELWRVYKFGLPEELIAELDHELRQHPASEFGDAFGAALAAIRRLDDGGDRQ